MPTLSSRQAQITTTCSAPGDDKVGVITTLGFQCNDTPNPWPIFFDNSVLSMVFCYLIYSTTVNLFVKMRYESIFHTCHQTKLNNILVNDCNIL